MSSPISPPPPQITQDDTIVSTFHMRVKCQRCDIYTTMKLKRILGKMICNECIVKNFSLIQIKEKNIKANQIAPFHAFEHNQDIKEIK